MTANSTELFGEQVRRMIGSLGDEFKEPDDDWVSMLFWEDAEGPGLAPLPPWMMGSDKDKDALVGVLAKLLQQFKATRYALLLNGWAIKSPTEGISREAAEERVHATHAEWSGHYDAHPDSYEVLSLFVVDRQNEQMWMAEIKRNDTTPPTLGEWTLADEGGGRFAQLARVLREDDE